MENIVVDPIKTQKKQEANRISSKKYREKLKEQRNEIEKQRSDRLLYSSSKRCQTPRNSS